MDYRRKRAVALAQRQKVNPAMVYLEIGGLALLVIAALTAL